MISQTCIILSICIFLKWISLNSINFFFRQQTLLVRRDDHVCKCLQHPVFAISRHVHRAPAPTAHEPHNGATPSDRPLDKNTMSLCFRTCLDYIIILVTVFMLEQLKHPAIRCFAEAMDYYNFQGKSASQFCEIFFRVCEINNLSNIICRLSEFFFEGLFDAKLCDIFQYLNRTNMERVSNLF